MKKYSKGFTLIELLVVIAIIGVLSSVVLASLNSARNKGSDAAIKANLANIRPQAEIIYDQNSCYGTKDGTTDCVNFAVAACASTDGTLFEDPTIANQILAAAKAGGGDAIDDANCVATASGASAKWAVSAPLKSTPTNVWCVDSAGAAREVTPAGTDRGFASGVCK